MSLWMHGTRGTCVEFARASGFAQRDARETAELVASTTGVDLSALLASDDYRDTVGSLKALVKPGVSVTSDRGLATGYARTGSGTLSDLLTGAHFLLGPPESRDDFLARWLAKHEPRPAIIVFLVEDSQVTQQALSEGTLSFDTARQTATTVEYLDDDTSQPW